MIILDCSAAIAIVRKTPEGQALSQLVSDDEKIIAPNLFYAELGNSLFKYARAGEIEGGQGKRCDQGGREPRRWIPVGRGLFDRGGRRGRAS